MPFERTKHYFLKKRRTAILSLFGCVCVSGGLLFFSLKEFYIPVLPTNYLKEGVGKEEIVPPVAKHLDTPEAVKAIYMTQCVAGTPSFRQDLVDLVEETELNSIIIDVKDYSGGIGFLTDDPKLKEFVSDKCRAPDIKEFIEELHDKGIYVIARITVFQDPLYVQSYPEMAVKKASDGTVWKDY
ncbi:putative glycoside hydrolase, partial [Patescibacteria group bacterium]|nr:putative glycoside hydrolase [Patescibacteria group bacterium]